MISPLSENPEEGRDLEQSVKSRVCVCVCKCRIAVFAQDEEEAEPCVFWPGKGESLSWETLTVTQTCENVICLANEDVLLVHHLAVHVAQVARFKITTNLSYRTRHFITMKENKSMSSCES